MLGVYAADASSVYAVVFSGDESNGVWHVSQNGRSVGQIARLPAGAFANDLVLDPMGRLLITDSSGGRIFADTPSGGRTDAQVWLQDPLLLGNVADPARWGLSAPTVSA